MIDGFLYKYIYLIFVWILTLSTVNQYYRTNCYLAPKNRSFGIQTFGVMIFLIFFIGLRPNSYMFVDHMNFYFEYQRLYGLPANYSLEAENFLFDNILPFFSSNKIPVEFYFLLIAAIYFGGIAWASKKLFPNDTFLAFLMYLGAFSTFSYGTNGIKAGAAASIFLVALAYKDNLKVCIPLLWVSLGFHHSMLAPVVAFAIAFFFRNPKYCFYAWLLCLLLAAAHITSFMEYFSGFTDDHGAKYLNTNVKNTVLYVSGFRPDFILYSAVPIFLGYYYIQKEKIISDTYNFLWCVYTLTNCVFLLCTYGTFINRIAYLSWLMLPFVLLYPVLYCEEDAFQHRNLCYVVYGHLGFTLFMNVFYYGL